MTRADLLSHAKAFGFAATATLAILALVTYYLGFEAALVATFLIVLEISLSFDNAVVNARVLARMSRFWQDIFLTIGILIAVFGVRIVLPIIIVAVAAALPFGEVLSLALNDPEQYERYLEGARPVIAAFGGMFLFLVFLAFFVLENTKHHWVRPLETTFQRLPRRWFSAPLVALGVLLVFALASQHTITVLAAGLAGIAAFMLLHGLVRFMQTRHLANSAAKLTGIGGFTGFLYLEVLDASFSLDSVIAAFAITSSVILIAAGLGAGAVWIRSMTIYLVRHETLGKYIYLEQGAHYAIGVLSLVLLSSIFFHVPEIITGLAGLSIIILSVISSRRAKRGVDTLKAPAK